jgi:DNA-binding beta-propeller fold protein YncE
MGEVIQGAGVLKIGRLWALLAGMLCWGYGAMAAIQPADKAVLNQTQVMFAWDEYTGADNYQLLIDDNEANTATDQFYPVQSLAKLVKTGLSFGHTYQWYYKAFKNDKEVYRSPTFSFRIAGSSLVDDNLYRYTIRKKRLGPYADNLIFIDHLGVAIDRRGKPVWYMPFDSLAFGVIPKYRNLQMTPSGSFTFLRGSDCFEKDSQGQLLWTAPNNGAVSQSPTEFYHHDFAKNADGTYMVCSYQYVEMPNLLQPSVTSRVRYNTVIQYDAAGQVVWQWNEKDHSEPAAIFAGSNRDETEVAGTHMNGFSCDDKTGVCIFSFRNNSTLQVIHKATGKVLYTLQGEKQPPGDIAFAAQHSPVFLPNGDLLVYNNNVKAKADSGQLVFPKIVQLRFDKNYQAVQKVWEYECRMDDYPDGLSGKEGFANLLPNNHVLINIGGGNKILEVDQNKKTVWEMDMTAYDDKKQAWLPIGNYRSHFTSSLYPRFFTVQQTSGKGPVKLGQSIRIKINNDGSEADRYQVELFSNGIFAPYSQIFRLAPGTALEQTIYLKKGKSKSGGSNKQFTVVKITPMGNPSGVKDLEYEIR